MRLVELKKCYVKVSRSSSDCFGRFEWLEGDRKRDGKTTGDFGVEGENKNSRKVTDLCE